VVMTLPVKKFGGRRYSCRTAVKRNLYYFLIQIKYQVTLVRAVH